MEVKLELLCKFQTEKMVTFHYYLGGLPMPIVPTDVIHFSDDVSKFVRVEFSKDQYLPNERLEAAVYVNDHLLQKVERLSLKPEFSHDGKHLAYPTASALAVSQNGQKILMPKFSYEMNVDEQVFSGFSGILHNVVFDENSNSWAFSAQTSMMDVFVNAMLPGFQANNLASDLKQFVIYNGVKQKEYLKILGYPKFSKNGSVWGYVAATGQINKLIDGGMGMSQAAMNKMHELMYKDAKMVAVINQVEGEIFDDIFGDIAFNGDGSQYAYAAKNGNEAFIILNGKRLETYDEVRLPIFLSKNRLAYFAYNKAKNKHFVVVDGRKEKEYDGFGAQGIITNDEGNYAYTAHLGNKWTVIFNGKEMGFHQGIQKNCPVLSKKGNTIGFAVINNNKINMQINNHVDNIQFDNISKPWFSEDGTRYAYTGIIAGQEYIVIDGKKHGPFYDSLPRFYFSPDNQKVAYFIAKRSEPHSSKLPLTKKYFLMINDKECDNFSLVSDFSPKTFQWIDNQHFRFGGMRITEDTVFIYKAIASDIQSTEARVCGKCGNKIESDSQKFCNKCGNNLSN
ncbi:MAG: zinc ribbon domain-containing protein [Candidatus Thorarchaeota archaeon]